MSLFWKHFLLFAAFGTIIETATKPTECQMWNKVATSAMAQEFLNVTCATNNLCTGFTCAGSLLYQNQDFLGKESFGFAAEFIPCSFPLVLRLLVNSTDLHFMKLVGVHGRNEEAILLAIPGSSGYDEAYGRVNLAWNAVLKPVKYFVALQINFTRIFMTREFPPIPMIPLQDYPVPNCQYGLSDVTMLTKRPYAGLKPWGDKACEGDECQDLDGTFVTEEPEKFIDYGFILKVCVGVGAVLFGLCILAGIVLVRHHRRAVSIHKVEVDEDSKLESENDESQDSSSDLAEDKHNLLRV